MTKIHLPLPGFGTYGNILPKYASATGGEIFAEFTPQALESAYGASMEEARSQYTLVVQHLGYGFHHLPQDRGAGERLRSEPEGVRPRRILPDTAGTVNGHRTG